MKLDSPKKVAIFVSVLVGGTTTLITSLFLFLSDRFTWWILPVLFVGVSIVCFVLIYYSIEYFINKRIRLIYRTIRNYKMGSETELNLNMTEDVLNNVNKEVIDWAQKSRKQINRLKEQESFRREFIGNLSHELRTPVFSVQGYILTLLEGGLEDESINRKFLQRASKGVDRITHIIEDLDSITRMEDSRLTMDIKKENVVDLASEVMDSFEMKASKRNVKICFDVAYDKAIWVKMDRAYISQVFTNLINNSINYGIEEGTTEVRFHDMEDRILVEVSDNGIGISQEHLPRLFERFYRVDKSRNRNEGGSGLGLAIVKHILEGHGQRINVRSTVGEGSTFSFTLDKAV